MEIAPFPSDERARLHTLFEYHILDTPPESEFDDLTLLASHICQTPIALISLIDPVRQWFKSKVGISASETPRNIAFCTHAILDEQTFIIPDAATDPRFADNPLVTQDPHIRFYAGVPLVTEGGQALGTLCVIDRIPRDLDQSEQEALQALARQVMSQLELRRLLSKQKQQTQQLRQFQAELQEAEISLQDSRQFLHSTLDALSAHIAILDENGTILAVNEGWRKFASQNHFRGAHVGLGENYLEITTKAAGSDQKAEEVLSGFHKIVQGQLDYVEIEYPCHSPVEARWFLLRITRFVSSGAARVVMAHENVTLRTEMQKALQESEERFNLAIRGTNDGIWDWTDVSQDAEWWSPQFYRLVGYQPEEFPASLSTFKELLHPDDLERTFQLVQDHLEKNVPFDIEYRLQMKSGEYRWFHGRGDSLRNGDGRPMRMTGSIQDITLRREAQDAFIRVNRYNSLILASVGEGIYGLDTEGHVTFINPAAATLLGYEPDELIGRQIHATIHHTKADGSPYPQNDCPLHDAFRQGESTHLEDEMFWRKGGTNLRVEVTNTLIRGEQNEILGAVVLFKDSTHRHQAEHERQQFITELEQKNSELEQFAYTVSHDLKSPLVTIRGFIGHLKKIPMESNRPRMENYLERIDTAAAKMQVLLEDLLTLSRVGRGVGLFEDIALAEVVQEALELTHGFRVENSHVGIHISSALPVVCGDRARLVQLFQNLLENAFKFFGQQSDPCIEINVRRDEAAEVIVIRDNGIGIEHAYQEKVFEIFERLNKEISGTGVGLALVKRIVGLHQGQIWVESKGHGQGTAMCFTLPSHRKDEEHAKNVSRS